MRRGVRSKAKACLSVLMAMAASLVLVGCGEINSSLAESLSGKIPHWAGGLPADAPPRATDPKYVAYIEKLKGKAGAETPEADADPGAEAQPSPPQTAEPAQ